MLFSEYRGSVSKGGPRVLTFVPTTIGQILANCPACTPRWSLSTVLGEDFADTNDPGLGGQPLALGWYEIQTEVDLYWQQVNPSVACSVIPYRSGLFLPAGSCSIFYVSAPDRDGIIVLDFCSVTPSPTSCGGAPSGLARVNRRDTILSMAASHGAEIIEAEASQACVGRGGTGSGSGVG
jgi:hypothetical protein